jgi:hypothetical protein
MAVCFPLPKRHGTIFFRSRLTKDYKCSIILSMRLLGRKNLKLNRPRPVQEIMKINPLRVAFLAAAAFALLFVSPNSASAQVYASIRIGTPPPPMIVERPWPPPYRGAYWIPGHHEWRGRWVWVPGYYSYPPRRGGYWVAPGYRHGYYYPGHWAY